MDEIHDQAEAGSPADGSTAAERSDRRTGENSGWANLRPPWPKGVSGNPAGRPKGKSLTALIDDLLEQDEIGGKKFPGGKQVKHLLVEALAKQALKGDIRHLQEILNRIDGKLSERVEHTGWGGRPIEVDATVCVLSAEQIDAWRQQKRAEISARPTGPPP